jgi:hypothetical protein
MGANYASHKIKLLSFPLIRKTIVTCQKTIITKQNVLAPQVSLFTNYWNITGRFVSNNYFFKR